MNTAYRLFAAVLLVAFCTSPFAQDVEIAFSNDYGEFSYGQSAELINPTGDQVRGGVIVHENNDIIVHGTYMTDVLPQIRAVRLNVGSRVYFAGLTDPDDDIIGLSFGGSARFKVPIDIVPLYLSSTFFFAPAVITSGADSRIFDFDVVRAEVGLTERIHGFAGLRRLNIEREDAENSIIHHGYVGIRYFF